MKLGDRGNEVVAWQRILHALGLGRVAGAVDGIFGPKTEAATRAAEAEMKLPPTGTVYKILENAAADALARLAGVHPVVAAARSQLGIRETTMNRGPGIGKYWAATTYPNGEANREPWCAAFAAWCVREGMLANAGLRITEVTRPKSAVVADWVLHALRMGWLVFGPHDGLRFPAAGDIVIYTFSHMGVVEDFDGHVVTAIEGNTNAAGSREGIEVMRRKRMLSACKSFIRLPRKAGGAA